jgi:hypothetical protein
MSDVSVEGIRARADAAMDELATVLAALAALDAPTRLAVLVDVVRASAELRLRAERELGRLLHEYPDPGGRPSPCRQTPMGRQLRQALDLNRTVCMWLVRLASEVDDAAFEKLVDEVWQGYPSAGRMGARSVVLSERAPVGGKPPPSGVGE